MVTTYLCRLYSKSTFKMFDIIVNKLSSKTLPPPPPPPPQYPLTKDGYLCHLYYKTTFEMVYIIVNKSSSKTFHPLEVTRKRHWRCTPLTEASRMSRWELQLFATVTRVWPPHSLSCNSHHLWETEETERTWVIISNPPYSLIFPCLSQSQPVKPSLRILSGATGRWCLATCT